jgi:YesN/AraC family two-component response regulator
MVDIKELVQYSKKLNVLYVEDDKDFAANTVEILEVFFSNVKLEVNGKNALEEYIKFNKINDNYYDLVITDIQMPKMNGLELTKSIYNYNSSQTIIVISAHNESHYLLEFVNIGIEYFIVKPFDIEEIMNVLYKSSKKIYDIKLKEENHIIDLVNNFTWNKNTSSLYYKSNKKRELFY